MKFDNRAVLDAFMDDLDSSVELGWRRAYKHMDEPTELDIIRSIQDQVELCVHRWIDFELYDES